MFHKCAVSLGWVWWRLDWLGWAGFGVGLWLDLGLGWVVVGLVELDWVGFGLQLDWGWLGCLRPFAPVLSLAAWRRGKALVHGHQLSTGMGQG